MSPSRPSRLPWPLRARFLQWVVSMGPQAGSVLWESCPRPTGQFFKRCGDRSPGVAPGIGRERVGGAVAGHGHTRSAVRQGPWPGGHIRA